MAILREGPYRPQTAMSAGPRVAIVEDDPSSRRTLLRVLRAGGFRALVYESAEDYLASPPDPPPIGLLLDMHLGAMSGLELQQRLRDDGSRVPVIVITGLDDGRCEEESRRLGCLAYLHKPCDAAAILTLLAQLAG
jgi:FixJ family two-component response regulator